MLKLHTYQLGTPRHRGEGLRVGVVRHLPRGMRKEDSARLDHLMSGSPLSHPVLAFTARTRQTAPASRYVSGAAMCPPPQP
ncbi:hypothetical protein TFLX_05025 [Thermoflexales bacterium]|nr:hypothetical protein TFLX_05025 [Thermoflexales bacterium]